MRFFSFFLLAAASLTLVALVAAAPAQPWAKALLGFQLPALWTLLAMGGIFRGTRARQPVPLALYLAMACALLCCGYFAWHFVAAPHP